jgi:penicillin amidase
LVLHLLSEKLGDLANRYAGGTILSERSREWLDKILDESDSYWFDLGNGEKRDDVLKLVLRDSVDYLKQKLGPGVNDWAWSKLHKLTFTHPLGAVKPLDKLFNRGPYPIGGDSDTIWATASSRVDVEKQVTVGPPFRFIADLGNLDNCLGLLVPGQSGQPSSPHYADNIQAWFEGKYHPMLFNRKDVLREAKTTLVLNPLSDKKQLPST